MEHLLPFFIHCLGNQGYFKAAGCTDSLDVYVQALAPDSFKDIEVKIEKRLYCPGFSQHPLLVVEFLSAEHALLQNM